LKQQPASRMTRQREVILKEVRDSGSHPTADEIYERVRKKIPRISLGTVYRNLELLASSGLISRLEPEHTQMRFDWKTSDHYHITCIRCGAVEDADIKTSDNPFEHLEHALGNLTKYGIFGHKLEFVGLCKKCRSEEGDI